MPILWGKVDFSRQVANKRKFSMVLSWQGMRAGDSLDRRYLPECDAGGGLFNYRPILKGSVEAVFEAHRVAGIKQNPLYLQGCNRVDCMPCVMCAKDEMREIAFRWPGELARVRERERLASIVSKRGSATFFAATNDPPCMRTTTSVLQPTASSTV